MKRVVSISLGSTKGDKTATANFLGEDFELSRIGTNGDMKRFAELVRENDGKADAITLGGIDLYLVAGKKKHTVRDAAKLAANAKKSAVVDGSGLKNTLERETVEWLQREGIVDFSKKNVLVVSAVDRFGMGEAIGRLAKSVAYGDIMFALGLPIPMKSWGAVRLVGSLLLPIIVRLPFQWLYPTGEKQDQNTPKFENYFRWADVIAGDNKYIAKYMPAADSDALKGKTIITNTLTETEVENLKARGVSMAITGTMEFDGRTFGTNVMEGAIVTLAGKHPEEMSPEDYLETMKKLNWKPTIRRLG